MPALCGEVPGNAGYDLTEMNPGSVDQDTVSPIEWAHSEDLVRLEIEFVPGLE